MGSKGTTINDYTRPFFKTFSPMMSFQDKIICFPNKPTNRFQYFLVFTQHNNIEEVLLTGVIFFC